MHVPQYQQQPQQQGLSVEEVKTLLKKVIERKPNEILTFTQIKEDWRRYYPCLLPLDRYAPRLAEILEQLPNAAVLGDRLVPMRTTPPVPAAPATPSPAMLLAKLEELVRAAGGPAALKPALMKLGVRSPSPAEPEPKNILERIVSQPKGQAEPPGLPAPQPEKEVMQKLLNQLFISRVTVAGEAPADENILSPEQTGIKQGPISGASATRVYTKAELLQAKPPRV